eukprot:457908-Rhodomonas_salina.3
MVMVSQNFDHTCRLKTCRRGNCAHQNLSKGGNSELNKLGSRELAAETYSRTSSSCKTANSSVSILVHQLLSPKGWRRSCPGGLKPNRFDWWEITRGQIKPKGEPLVQRCTAIIAFVFDFGCNLPLVPQGV